jgi:hypothetical protein
MATDDDCIKWVHPVEEAVDEGNHEDDEDEGVELNQDDEEVDAEGPNQEDDDDLALGKKPFQEEGSTVCPRDSPFWVAP